MSQSTPCSSPWIDYTDAHRMIRQELEKAIIDYVINGSKGIRAPVIVAPYGSGKTTLLRHLLCYSIMHDIPVIKVNLLTLVSFLENNGISNIDEDHLIGYIVKFLNHAIGCVLSNKQKCSFDAKVIIDEFDSIKADWSVITSVLNKFLHGNKKCVLLIDEIEEGYEDLKKIVRFKTTPFRDVFDKVYSGTSRIFPILAFGPSSIYSEVVSNAGSWRVTSHVIPIITPTSIMQKIANTQSHNLSSYISNLIWWMGKGRPGHVDKLIQMNLHVEAQDALASCQSMLEAGAVKNLQGTYVVSSIPYIDQAAYRRIETSLNDDERYLFYLLSILIGPVPESKLSDCRRINTKKIWYSKLSDYFIKSTSLIKVNDALSVLEKALLNLSYIMNDFSRDMVYALFLSWSDHDVMLLDKRALTELISIVKDMAIEFYQNDLFNALNKLDLNSLYTELLNNKIEGEKPYYALSPSALSAIYPPVLLMPLIGCCKDKSINDLYKIFNEFTVKDIHDLSNELQKKIINYASMSGLNNEFIQIMNNYKIIFIIDKYMANDEFIKQVKELLTNNDVYGVIFIPLPYGQDPSSMINSLRQKWQKYVDIGLVDIMYPSARAILFLMGLIYNKYVECDVKNTDREIGMYDQFMRAIIELLKDIINRLSVKRREISQKTSKAVKDLVDVLSDGYREVGSGKERYLLLLAGSEHRYMLEDYLDALIAKDTSAIGIIDDVIKKINDLLKMVYNYGVISEQKASSGFDEFLKNGWRYYSSIREDFDKIYNEIQKESIFNDIFEVLSDLYDVLDLQNNKADLLQLINELNKVTEKITDISGDYIGSLITWMALQKMLNKYSSKLSFNDKEECEDSMKEIELFSDKLSSLNKIAGKINSIINKIRKYTDVSPAIIEDLEKIVGIIDDIKNSTGKIWDYLDKCSEMMISLNTVEEMWFLDFIIKGSGRNKGLISNLIENISNIIDFINSKLQGSLEEAIKSLNDIEMNLNNIKDSIGNNEQLLLIDYEMLMQYYKEDLEQVLLNSRSPYELSNNLRELNEAIKGLANTVNELTKGGNLPSTLNKIQYLYNNIKDLLDKSKIDD